jgi:hypothetical protein
MHPTSVYPISEAYSEGPKNIYKLQHSGVCINRSPKDRSFKQKINKEILKVNHTIDQMDLAGVYRIFYPTSAQYSFSETQETFSKIDHILGYKQVSANIRKQK